MSFASSSGGGGGISFNFGQTNASKPSFGASSFGSFSTPTSFGTTFSFASSGSLFSTPQSFGSLSTNPPSLTTTTTPNWSFSSTPTTSSQGIGASSAAFSFSFSQSGSSFVPNSSSSSSSSASSSSTLFSSPSSSAFFGSFASSGSSFSSGFGTTSFSQPLFATTPAASSSSFSFGSSSAGFHTVASTGGAFSFSSAAANTIRAPSSQSSLFSLGNTSMSSSVASFPSFASPSSNSSSFSSFSASVSLPVTTSATSTPAVSSGWSIGGMSSTSSSASVSAPLLFSSSSTPFSAPTTLLGSTTSSSFSGAALGNWSSTGTTSNATTMGTLGGFTAAASSSSLAVETSSALSGVVVGSNSSNDMTTTTSTNELLSQVKDLHLNEIINSWNDKVEELVDRFMSQAALVNRWDRFLYQNERRIESLYTEAQGIHSAHKELEMNLDTALAQQKELDGYLQTLENQLEKYFVSVGDMGSTSADYEREEMYRTATKLASELDTIGTSLRQVVSDIHQMNKPAEDDVVGQIVAILDAHLKSLEYLDETCSQLGKRTQELSLVSDRVEKDTQRLLQGSHLRFSR